MHCSVKKTLLSLLLTSSSSIAIANDFTLTSSDISHGEFMGNTFEFQGLGCTGKNISPELSWKGAPSDTKAFAVMAYDPDAPTGSGWWHWQVVNIPANVTSVSSGDGMFDGLPVTNIKNDYGLKGFGGACPPEGHGAHRYQFTVYALSKKLELPEGASGALTGYMVKAHSLASATIEALYKR